jgi:hypothetical protein
MRSGPPQPGRPIYVIRSMRAVKSERMEIVSSRGLALTSAMQLAIDGDYSAIGSENVRLEVRLSPDAFRKRLIRAEAPPADNVAPAVGAGTSAPTSDPAVHQPSLIGVMHVIVRLCR